MVKSMTGFGRGEAVAKDKHFVAELRSLNSKQLDLSVRLPVEYRQADYDVRMLAGRIVGRGKADLYVTVESTAPAAPVMGTTIDRDRFRAYMAALTDTAEYAGVPVDTAALMPVVLRLPDVMTTAVPTVSEEEIAALMQAVEAAALRLNEFREQEGATLIADLLERVRLIEEYRDAVTPLEAARTVAVRERLLEQLAKFTSVEVNAERLEQEMIYYLEKLDITEEKVRLTKHCDYFREVAATEEAPGRKLGFIAQEMGREINTLGSKANNAEIQVLVVKMKDELEKIKEQVLNIL